MGYYETGRHWSDFIPDGWDCDEFAIDDELEARAPVEPPVLSRAAIDDLFSWYFEQRGLDKYTVSVEWLEEVLAVLESLQEHHD